MKPDPALQRWRTAPETAPQTWVHGVSSDLQGGCTEHDGKNLKLRGGKGSCQTRRTIVDCVARGAPPARVEFEGKSRGGEAHATQGPRAPLYLLREHFTDG